MNNYYLVSQLVAERQAALAADVSHRTQLKDARAARDASTASLVRPARTNWLFFARLAHTGA
jgi:hypothetical protein